MRPLIKRAPDGRRVVVPSQPRHPAATPPPQPRVKLDADEVRAIRADYAAGRWDQYDLAYIYGVTQSTINSVVQGRTWRHVTDQPREQDS